MCGSSLENGMEMLIKIIIKKNIESKMIDLEIFPTKYSDYTNIFNKHQADILSNYSQHHLAIKIKGDQVPFFGPTYDHSKPELEVLCKYINNILEKGFIIFFKSPLGAPVLFTKKNNGDLYFCVDFRSLNAMIKKNKHSFLLIFILLNLLAKTKCYTKINSIAAYNSLRIK